MEDPKLQEIVERLVAAYEPERIYLFGSVARGEAGPDSDYDILVVVPPDAPPDRLRSKLAYRVLWGIGVPVDAVVMTRPDFDLRVHVVNSLPEAALREGRLVYAA